MMRKRWIIKKCNTAGQKRLVDELGVPPVIARLLVNRSINSPEEAQFFLHAGIEDLHDPFLLKGMDKAVSRIKKALSRGEKILVYGDYDVDGLTSVALLSEVLKELGGNIIEYIPNRLEEGYGLNLTAAQQAYRKKVGVVVTVDCGVSGIKEIGYLKTCGIDTIVVDHHKPGPELPKACAIIDPLQKNCTYPFKYLAGVGLTFKLVQALLGKKPAQLRKHLDLVALGTIADVSPQLGENRILTRCGLMAMAETKNVGIKELIRASGLIGKEITSRHIGFILGPRINASGRIGSPKLALRLLTTRNREEAKELAKTLDRENRNRQKVQGAVYEQALDKANREVNFKEHKVIVLSGEGWHPGVIGIVASRLAEKFYRPTVMISLQKNIGRGSARSIKNFHLFDIISRCKEHLETFGGHEAACGLTILPKFVNKFKEHINSVASDVLSPEDLLPSLEADMEIPLSGLSSGLIGQIEKLEPYGPCNPRPLLVSRNLTVKHDPKIVGRKGVKMWVTDGGITCEALIFGLEDTSGISKESVVNLAYTPSVNSWRGVSSIQLDLKDIKGPS